MSKDYKIIHFRENCIGCNACVECATAYWEVDANDGKANLKNSVEKNGVYIAEISEPEIASNRLAAQSCPMGIIHLNDKEGKDVTAG